MRVVVWRRAQSKFATLLAAAGAHIPPPPPKKNQNSFLFFLAVYTGVAKNANLSAFIRYNAMQAVLLDVLIM